MDFYRITTAALPSFLPLLTKNIQQQLQSPHTYAVGAEEDGVACGVLVFTVTDTFVTLNYIAVSDKYRRKGCATGMIQWLCHYADGVDSAVLCPFSAQDEEDPIYQLFHSMYNFSVDDEAGKIFELSAEQLRESELLVKFRQCKQKIFPIFDLPKYMARDLIQSGLGLTTEEDSYISELSLCTMNGEEISAAVVFQPGETAESLYLAYAFCDPQSPKSLMVLYAKAAEKIETEYRDCRSICIAAATPASEAMIAKLFPQAQQVGRFFLAGWDMTF